MHKYTKIIDKRNFKTIDSSKNTIKDHKKHIKINNVHFENNFPIIVFTCLGNALKSPIHSK